MDALPQRKTVTVYVRHNSECPNKADIYTRGGKRNGCNCPLWLYTYDGNTAKRFSAKTRTWSKAEELKKHYEENPEYTPDPQPAFASPAAAISIEKALERWLKSLKNLRPGTLSAYTSFTRKFNRWAERRHLVYLNEVTANMLDEWRSEWREDAEHDDDQINASTQSALLVRLKKFFDWATGIELIQKNPASKLERIQPDYEQTNVLTPAQFQTLLDSIEPFCASQVGDVRGFANELRALFLLQRWTGLRLIDCLVLPRTAVKGDRLSTKTQKTGAKVDRRLPQVVVEALNTLAVDRPKYRPTHFLWGTNIQQKTLSSRWAKIIGKMDIRFINEDGNEFRFHSHCLRDTFAVELILAGMKLENVSKLLTHNSIRTTEKHYTQWVKARETMLEAELERAITAMGTSFA